MMFSFLLTKLSHFKSNAVGNSEPQLSIIIVTRASLPSSCCCLQTLMLVLLTIIDMTVGTKCGNCTSGGFVDEAHKVNPAVSHLNYLLSGFAISPSLHIIVQQILENKIHVQVMFFLSVKY